MEAVHVNKQRLQCGARTEGLHESFAEHPNWDVSHLAGEQFATYVLLWVF